MTISIQNKEHQQNQDAEKITAALHSVYGLALLRDLLTQDAGQAVLGLLRTLVHPQPDPVKTAEAYSAAFYQLAEAISDAPASPIVDAWQAYLIDRLIDTQNIWSTQVEQRGGGHISPALRNQAQRELRTLQHLFALDAQLIWEETCSIVTPTMPILSQAWAPWTGLQLQHEESQHPARLELIQTIAACTDWQDLAIPLERYWSRYGTGPLARYHVLRWQSEIQQLYGIDHPDKVELTRLIGHERQQPRITANVERFLEGLPAHDMLLYGPPGTGKSSTVKAIANTYAQHGLCLVEVEKEHINDLPQVVATLRGRAPHYLLFIDDLSFEEHETSYKRLKVLLEGTAEARPANILVCATSNRMNLVRENFQERGKPNEDVHWRDTMDEKQSLVHRFGLRVSYLAPDQKQYLHIVNQLAQQRGLMIPEEILSARALAWERQNSSRSGRSARQFIDDIEAETKSEQSTYISAS
ncbi:hypothetical protein KDA_19500 [Dictyobacter alpinus]|uniref:AAA+ ATPase domain-containing protein n=1 Tax=Dictyobacter alpinus TaxID=2014873 RepID=A0A402B544_9CHLR|nr:ATP-binding protein [Dictyobacter alpinus]GCE26466.1 hypothetical protein KDA_19500 [Dictyobacter alpinus]